MVWLKSYLSSITCHYMSLLHSDSHTKFQKKEIVKESVVSHIIRDLWQLLMNTK